MINSIVGAFRAGWELIKVIWNVVKPFFNGIWQGIKAIFSVAGIVLSTFFKNAWELIKLVWDTVVLYFSTLWENIKAIFSFVVTFFSETFKLAWEGIKAVWDTVILYFKTIWETIKGVFSVVKDVLTGNFSDAWEGIKGIINTWTGYFSGIWKNIKNVFSGVASWFGGVFRGAWDAIKGVFSNWSSFFGGLWNTISNKFSTIGTNIANAISSSIKSGLNGVISAIENIINSGINLINSAIGMINKLPGVSVGKIGRLSLPRLAKGGIVDEPTVAEIGEDGKEAVIPLENNLGWINNLAEKLISELKSIVLPTGKGIDNITNEQPMQQYQVAFNTQLEVLNDRFDQLINLIGEYLPDIASNMDRNIVLDSNSLVVGMSRKMDSQLGKISSAKGRGNI